MSKEFIPENSAADFSEEEPIVELRHIKKEFKTPEGRVTALYDIDLKIRRGEIFGIIGLSGAGKSTLVRCINLLETPTEGTVLFEGRELTGIPEKEKRIARQSMGMIFQQFNLLWQRNVIKNILFPLEIKKIPKKEALKQAEKLLELVGLSDKARAYPAQLSGGQKQRVAIARAIASEPKVLLCDEATSALDPDTTKSILELLKRINRELGITVIIITHEMKVIESICDRVAVIDNSRIAESGSVSEIFSNPKSDIGRRLILGDRLTDRAVYDNMIKNFFGGEN